MSGSGAAVRSDYCEMLEESFQNNLRVIEEQEKVIEEQERAIYQASKQAEELHKIIKQMDNQIEQKNLELRILQADCNQKLEEKTREADEASKYLQKRLREDCESTSARFTQQLKLLRAQLSEKEGAIRRQLSQNSRLTEMTREQKRQLLELSEEVRRVNQEKNQLANSMSLHERELEGIRRSSCEWEDLLRAKLQEAQKDKQAVEEQLSEYKIAAKEKLRKQKEDFGKKITQVSEQMEHRLSEALHQQKQLRFKLQKANAESKDWQRELESVREEKSKLQLQINRFKDNQLKSSFQKNQKEYEYLLKIFEQDKKELRGQVEQAAQEKQRIQEELDEVNSRRETGEKAVQRLKVELLNKSKECDEIKKENKKLRKDYETRMKEAEINLQQMQGREGYPNSSKPLNYDSKGFDLIESAKAEDYSKVFTDDMGIIDEKYFQASSPFRSPKHKPLQNGRQAQLMKKISELQVESQEYKTLIRKMREEMDGVKRQSEEDKIKEIGLYRDKANIYWEKANDKEQQLMALREQFSQLKANYQEASLEIKRYREKELEQRQKQEQLKILAQKIQNCQQERSELHGEIEILSKERDMLEKISTELRAENHSLQEMLNSAGLEDLDNQSKSRSIINEQSSKEQETVPVFGLAQQKFPKKLHDLVREKKQLAINGKRAQIEEREKRMGRVGTQSQKEVLQKIRSRSKTPPSVANYAELKREGERRNPYVETASQKQVFERLKNRQAGQPLSPQRGVNYLMMRERERAD